MSHLNRAQATFLCTAVQQAKQAGHIWPLMAACEAALESGYGHSALYTEGLNVFGTKQHVHPEYGTLSLPTKEFLDDHWVTVTAEWVKYPTLAAAFEDRMLTLRRLAPHYPHYAAALAALTAFDYITEVSQTWSTDPKRAAKVTEIFNWWSEEIGIPSDLT